MQVGHPKYIRAAYERKTCAMRSRFMAAVGKNEIIKMQV